MHQNYVRRLLALPQPKALTYDEQRREQVNRDHWIGVGRRNGKTRLTAGPLDRGALKNALFFSRYGMLNGSGSAQQVRRMSSRDFERLWQTGNSVWSTKELRDNAFGGGL